MDGVGRAGLRASLWSGPLSAMSPPRPQQPSISCHCNSSAERRSAPSHAPSRGAEGARTREAAESDTMVQESRGRMRKTLGVCQFRSKPNRGQELGFEKCDSRTVKAGPWNQR